MNLESEAEKKGKGNVDPTSKDYYFDSYSHFGIHEEMLKDEVRTRSYMNAIQQNKHLFAGKTVLDVGCGTGILSMFAAKAGARRVFSVECSGIVEQCRQIVKDNNLDNVITVIKGKIEEIELPFDDIDGDSTVQDAADMSSEDTSTLASSGSGSGNNDSNCDSLKQVDIIISEWMGYFLLYESMLESVIFARDKWLRPNTGIMLPDRCGLYLAAVEDEEYRSAKIDFWDSVYGFDMSVIKEIALTEPLVDCVEGNAVVSTSAPVFEVDVMRCTVEEGRGFSKDFSLNILRNDFVHGFVAYFDCSFSMIHKPIRFSTGPHDKYTHWKQTVFYLRDSVTVCADEVVNGTITCHPNTANPRDLDIKIEVRFAGRHYEGEGKTEYASTNNYRLR